MISLDAFGVQFALRAPVCCRQVQFVLRTFNLPFGRSMPTAFKETVLGCLPVKPLHRYTAIPFNAYGVQVLSCISCVSWLNKVVYFVVKNLGGLDTAYPLNRYTVKLLHRSMPTAFKCFRVFRVFRG